MTECPPGRLARTRAPLLFDIALEPLAACIRNDPEIKGIPLYGKEYKEIMYADDTLLFVSKPETTVPTILSVIDSLVVYQVIK